MQKLDTKVGEDIIHLLRSKRNIRLLYKLIRISVHEKRLFFQLLLISLPLFNATIVDSKSCISFTESQGINN